MERIEKPVTPIEAQDIEIEPVLPASRIYLDHALSFYGAVMDSYANAIKNPETNAGNMEQARRRWNEANVEMAKFALDQQDPLLASTCYEYIDGNSTEKWHLVADAHRAGFPILSESWMAPLLLEIEHGTAPLSALIAAYQTRASIALDRVQVSETEEERAEHRQTAAAAWDDAKTMLNEAMGDDLAPRRYYGKRSDSLRPEDDVRSYMLDFAELFNAHGYTQPAQETMREIYRITTDIPAYGYQDYSYEVDKKVRDIKQGAAPDENKLEVLLAAGDWKRALSWYDTGLDLSDDKLKNLKNALIVARYGEQIEASSLEHEALVAIADINGVLDQWGIERNEADTLALPALRLATLNSLDRIATRILEEGFGLPELNERVIGTLIDARKTVNPTDDLEGIRERVQIRTLQRLRGLKSIPIGETSIARHIDSSQQLLEKLKVAV